MEQPEAGDPLGRRLRCSQCGNRQIGVTVQPDTRTAEAIVRDGPAPETQLGQTTKWMDCGGGSPSNCR